MPSAGASIATAAWTSARTSPVWTGCCTARPAAARARRRRRSAGPRPSRTGPGRRSPRCRRRGSAAPSPPCPARRSRSRTRRRLRVRGVPRSCGRSFVLAVLRGTRPTRRSPQSVDPRGADTGLTDLTGRPPRGVHRRRPRPRPTSPPTRSRCSAAGTTTRSTAGIDEPNAMVVATVSADGRPSVADGAAQGRRRAGFVFFTNSGSRKGAELAGNPRCALLFPWHDLQRQVRVDGTARRWPAPSVEAYFATRPRGSQLGAWGLAPVAAWWPTRDELEAAYDARSSGSPADDVPVPAELGRLPGAPGDGGVLAGPAGPDARPAGLPA